MDLYHIALFLHIVTLVAASGATAVTKVAAARRARARTIGEALEWHDLLLSASKAFPIVLAAFVLTGAFMLSRGQPSVWSAGFVVAGLTGVVLLFASGTYLGLKGKALGAMLQSFAERNGRDHAPPALVPPFAIVALPVVNTTLALSVAFVMVTKPASVAVALAVLGLGAALGVAASLRRPSAVAARANASANANASA